MTSLPADKFRLAERGRVENGAWADLVVFDPQTIADIATYDDSRRHPAGIAHVLVNGEPVLEQGVPLASAAGQVLARA